MTPCRLFLVKQRMKKVCIFNYPPIGSFHDYHIETFDPLPYFANNARASIGEILLNGLNARRARRQAIQYPAGVDKLYRERDPRYMQMVDEFVNRFADFDLIVMSTYNFIHPDVFSCSLKNPIKILGFIDDPISTYDKIPHLWAFDGAFYISPGYRDGQLMKDALRNWGCSSVYWRPLTHLNNCQRPPNPDDAFFRQRTTDLIYVGGDYGAKISRLLKFKKYFDRRFQVYGRWPLKGYSGFAKRLIGKRGFPYRVRSLTHDERTRWYWNSRIGLNMHYSERPSETGNVRMYEVPAHGAMLLCDKATHDSHSLIFEPDVEAVYYDSTRDAIDRAEYYLAHEEERIDIAKAGYARFWRDYEPGKTLKDFLDWAVTVPRKRLAVTPAKRIDPIGNAAIK